MWFVQLTTLIMIWMVASSNVCVVKYPPLGILKYKAFSFTVPVIAHFREPIIFMQPTIIISYPTIIILPITQNW